jgi:transcriptional regulator with XRE-family HTH domain
MSELPGSELFDARMAKGLSQSEVAAKTRIKIQLIDDLEQNDFSRIAAPIYGKGFIKLYSDFLGIEAQPLIDEYLRIIASGGVRPSRKKKKPEAKSVLMKTPASEDKAPAEEAPPKEHEVVELSMPQAPEQESVESGSGELALDYGGAPQASTPADTPGVPAGPSPDSFFTPEPVRSPVPEPSAPSTAVDSPVESEFDKYIPEPSVPENDALITEPEAPVAETASETDEVTVSDPDTDLARALDMPTGPEGGDVGVEPSRDDRVEAPEDTPQEAMPEARDDGVAVSDVPLATGGDFVSTPAEVAESADDDGWEASLRSALPAGLASQSVLKLLAMAACLVVVSVILISGLARLVSQAGGSDSQDDNPVTLELRVAAPPPEPYYTR